MPMICTNVVTQQDSRKTKEREYDLRVRSTSYSVGSNAIVHYMCQICCNLDNDNSMTLHPEHQNEVRVHVFTVTFF